jgi:threonine/homoserine/homoserine lactone efflux protein
MPGIHDLALFTFTVFVLNATPGVDMAFTLLSTLRGGVRGGLVATAGICSGCVVHVLGSAFGLAALLAASATAFGIVKWAGAAYLLWLAVGMLREAGASSSRTRGGASVALASNATTRLLLFRQGFLTNVLNPKVALFFLALLPQFIDADAPHKTAAFLFLGAWSIAQGALFLVLFVLLVAPLRRWQPQPWTRRALHGLGGALFTMLALRLALTEKS